MEQILKQKQNKTHKNSFLEETSEKPYGGEKKMKNKSMSSVIVAILLLASLVVVPMAYADTQTTTFTFVVPSNVAHTLSYGGSCSNSAFYFRGDNAGDGTALVPYNAASAGSACQSTTPGIVINNAGNVAINMTAEFDALPNGVVVWTADTNGGAEVQSWSNVSVTAKTIATNIATSGTHDVFVYTNMTNFNSGVAGSQTATFTTTAIAS